MTIISQFLAKWGEMCIIQVFSRFFTVFSFSFFFRLILGLHWLLCYETMGNDFFFEKGTSFFSFEGTKKNVALIKTDHRKCRNFSIFDPLLYAGYTFFFQSKKVLGQSLNTNKNIVYGHYLEYSMKKKSRTFFVWSAS